LADAKHNVKEANETYTQRNTAFQILVARSKGETTKVVPESVPLPLTIPAFNDDSPIKIDINSDKVVLNAQRLNAQKGRGDAAAFQSPLQSLTNLLLVKVNDYSTLEAQALATVSVAPTPARREGGHFEGGTDTEYYLMNVADIPRTSEFDAIHTTLNQNAIQKEFYIEDDKKITTLDDTAASDQIATQIHTHLQYVTSFGRATEIPILQEQAGQRLEGQCAAMVGKNLLNRQRLEETLMSETWGTDGGSRKETINSQSGILDSILFNLSNENIGQELPSNKVDATPLQNILASMAPSNKRVHMLIDGLAKLKIGGDSGRILHIVEEKTMDASAKADIIASMTFLNSGELFMVIDDSHKKKGILFIKKATSGIPDDADHSPLLKRFGNTHPDGMLIRNQPNKEEHLYTEYSSAHSSLNGEIQLKGDITKGDLWKFYTKTLAEELELHKDKTLIQKKNDASTRIANMVRQLQNTPQIQTKKQAILERLKRDPSERINVATFELTNLPQILAKLDPTIQMIEVAAPPVSQGGYRSSSSLKYRRTHRGGTPATVGTTMMYVIFVQKAAGDELPATVDVETLKLPNVTNIVIEPPATGTVSFKKESSIKGEDISAIIKDVAGVQKGDLTTHMTKMSKRKTLKKEDTYRLYYTISHDDGPDSTKGEGHLPLSVTIGNPISSTGGTYSTAVFKYTVSGVAAGRTSKTINAVVEDASSPYKFKFAAVDGIDRLKSFEITCEDTNQIYHPYTKSSGQLAPPTILRPVVAKPSSPPPVGDEVDAATQAKALALVAVTATEADKADKKLNGMAKEVGDAIVEAARLQDAANATADEEFDAPDVEISDIKLEDLILEEDEETEGGGSVLPWRRQPHRRSSGGGDGLTKYDPADHKRTAAAALADIRTIVGSPDAWGAADKAQLQRFLNKNAALKKQKAARLAKQEAADAAEKLAKLIATQTEHIAHKKKCDDAKVTAVKQLETATQQANVAKLEKARLAVQTATSEEKATKEADAAHLKASINADIATAAQKAKADKASADAKTAAAEAVHAARIATTNAAKELADAKATTDAVLRAVIDTNTGVLQAKKDRQTKNEEAAKNAADEEERVAARLVEAARLAKEAAKAAEAAEEEATRLAKEAARLAVEKEEAARLAAEAARLAAEKAAAEAADEAKEAKVEAKVEAKEDEKPVTVVAEDGNVLVLGPAGPSTNTTRVAAEAKAKEEEKPVTVEKPVTEDGNTARVAVAAAEEGADYTKDGTLPAAKGGSHLLRKRTQRKSPKRATKRTQRRGRRSTSA
jgi:hypothetical protein